MRIGKPVTYSILLLSLSIGCTNSTEKKQVETSNQSEPFVIDISNVREIPTKGAPMMSDMIDSLEYIALETTADNLMSFIVDIQIFDDYIFIYGSHKSGLMQFSRDGKFIRQIGHYGQGAGEHLGLISFWVSEKDKVIYAFTNYEELILKYDLDTGKYLETVPIIQNGKKIEETGDSFSKVIPLNGESEQFIHYSRGIVTRSRFVPNKLKLFRILNPKNGEIYNAPTSRAYASTNAKVMIQPIFWQDADLRMNIKEAPSDTVYTIDANANLTPRIILKNNDFEKFKTATKFKEILKLSIFEKILENNRYIHLGFSHGEEGYDLAFDKVTGKTYRFPVPDDQDKLGYNFVGPENDVDGGFSRMKFTAMPNIWIGTYSAFDMLDLLSDDHFEKIKPTVKYPSRMEKLKRFVSTLNEDDNPVIVIAHLKK